MAQLDFRLMDPNQPGRIGQAFVENYQGAQQRAQQEAAALDAKEQELIGSAYFQLASTGPTKENAMRVFGSLQGQMRPEKYQKMMTMLQSTPDQVVPMLVKEGIAKHPEWQKQYIKSQFPDAAGGGAGGGTGRWTTGVDAEGNYIMMDPYNPGRSVVVAKAGQYDPRLRGSLSAAQSQGKELGTAVGEAQVNLPKVQDSANMMLDYIDSLIGNQERGIPRHPGFSTAVGASWLPGAGLVPGTQTRSFMNRLEQIQGGSFLEAFQMLKGGGQITEVEGQKATQAINRMNTSSSEKEFLDAAEDLRRIVKAGVERARRMSAGGVPAAGVVNQQPTGAVAGPPPGAVRRKQ